MPTLTLLSNGHGEDAVAVRLAGEIARLRPDLTLRPFPLVGDGRAYAGCGLEPLGPLAVMPSGGLTLHDPRLLLEDVRAGLIGVTLRQIAALRALDTDVLLVVGDVYAQLLSALPRARMRLVYQPLVSAHHSAHPPAIYAPDGPNGRPGALHRRFMETIGLPERWLMRRLAAHVYVRDPATEALLRRRGVEHVSALGNPMVDGLAGSPLPGLERSSTLALLPGSRRYAARSLSLMLAALADLEDEVALVAWAGGALPAPPGWSVERADVGDERDPWHGLVALLRRGAQRVFVLEGRFADVLASAWAALGTSGTANEQAAAVGLPVVAFPVPPLYSRAFLDNQKRLLADALELAPADAAAVASTIRRLRSDPERYRRAASAGAVRMGGPGGSRAIAADLVARAEAAGVLGGERRSGAPAPRRGPRGPNPT